MIEETHGSPAGAATGRGIDQRCRICGATKLRGFNHLGSTYRSCADCGCITKILTTGEYQALNPTYDPGDEYRAARREEMRDLLDVEGKKRFLAPLLAQLQQTEPVRLLDIGCGQGGIMLAAQELGCTVQGVEPSASHSRTARETFALPVLDGYFDSARILPQRFDVIILSHVIEHILTPQDFLEEVLSVLAPRGLLLIVTPNAGSIVARLTGRHWTMLKPPDHVSMLTERALRRMALPGVASMSFRQSEYLWEPFIGLVQSTRDAARGWLKPPHAVIAENAAKTASHSLARLQALRWYMWIFSALSVPLHLFNRLAGMQACLVIEIRKAGVL